VCLQEYGKQKAQWHEQLLQAAAAAKRFAEETLTSERGRHSAHLGEVQSEVAHLKVAWHADKAASQKLLEMEREKVGPLPCSAACTCECILCAGLGWTACMSAQIQISALVRLIHAYTDCVPC
jgi:hypothetical protein